MHEAITTTTNANLPLKRATFETLCEGLDYAAKGDTGCNFYSFRGDLAKSLTYREIRERAIALAQGMVRAGLKRGARVVIMAETTPDFPCVFFACQYAGLIPVPLPLSLNLGGRDSYVQRLKGLIAGAGAEAAVASEETIGDLREAVADLDLKLVGTPADFYDLPGEGADLRPFLADDPCYIQYSSGSTRFPHGVFISQRAATSNTRAIAQHGVVVGQDDRCVSWLPLYHDMGLVGFLFVPALTQLSVDFIATADFARRPLLWLRIISANGGTASFSPTFGYDLCRRRAENSTISDIDLSTWRVAGIGGDMIRADVLGRFSDRFAECGFRKTTFLASYGLAEATLAVCFASHDEVIEVDRVDKMAYALSDHAKPVADTASPSSANTRSFALCGRPMPGYKIEVRDKEGGILPDRRIGGVFITGPSIMTGYYNDAAETHRVLDADGWLDTGDMGYMLDGSLVITGRSKDLIIHNGRNIWPQDIEWAVERLPDLRSGDVAAFSVPGQDGAEAVVVLVQSRKTSPDANSSLKRDIAAIVRSTAGVDCRIVLVPPRSISMTSSGKISRAGARKNYLAGQFADLVGEASLPAGG
ncbi:MAG: fatty acyl-AMP ligase, partial [Alphaproteobacteria bacterium]|nr:fatty acyl-AMP ligase [Alphaproteobacteria bacterium]